MLPFGANIVIDGGPNSAAYEQEVLSELTHLLMFETGRCLIQQIWSMKHKLIINRWTGTGRNAATGPTSWPDANPNGAPALTGSGVQLQNTVGTGQGSNSILRYTPWIFDVDAGWDRGSREAWSTINGGAPPGPGLEQGEVLLHEMVHAYRQMLGVCHSRKMPGSNLDTREEFIAILVANLYSVERNRPMRANHRLASPEATGADVSRWLANQQLRQIVWGAMADMPALTLALARVRITPNPFAQFGLPTLSDLVYSGV